MNSNTKKGMLAAAVAGLMMAHNAVAADSGRAGQQAKAKCYGVNACKGQGFIETTPEDYRAKGGK